MTFHSFLLVSVAALFSQGPQDISVDWPGYLGPKTNGHYLGTHKTLLAQPVLQWSVQVGEGFSGPIAANGMAYLFHRVQDKEVLQALDLATGTKKWNMDFPATYQDDYSRGNGPRSTPGIVGNFLVLLSPEGTLRTIDINKQAVIWQSNLLETFEASKGYFGVGSSPILHEGKVLVAIGGKKAGLVCLDLKTGKLIWKSSPFKPGYASPLVILQNGKAKVLVFHREGLSVFNLQDGADLGFFKWRSRMDASVNAANPQFFDQKVFLSASYGTGAALLELNGEGIKPLWSGDQSLSAHYGTPLQEGSFMLGSHGRQEAGATLRCIEWKTGKEVWEKEGFGCGNLLASPLGIFALSESGELALFDTNLGKKVEKYSRKALDSLCISPPALSRGYFLARDGKKLICLKVME